MNELFETQRIILEQFNTKDLYMRSIFNSFTLDNSINGILGLRGIGKTTFLLMKAIENGAKENKALYFSADDIYFLKNTLLDTFIELYKNTDCNFVCIDEIHKYTNWNQELKNIADKFPSIKVVFTGSSTIDLIKSKYDLSRRVTVYDLHGLSFREYLEFYHNIKIPIIKIEDLIKNHTKLANSIDVNKILKEFKTYLKVGYYPFFKKFRSDFEKFQAIENSIKKTIYEDISILNKFETPTLNTIEKIFKFCINSSPGEINANKLANTLKKDNESVGNYIKILIESGLLRGLFPAKQGHSFLKTPIKIYPDNTNFIYSSYLPILSEETMGKVRETFFINHIENSGNKIFYSEKGDFKVGDFIFEVGGRSKTTKQIKNVENSFLICDDILIGDDRKIPLYLFGLLY